ncbi:MAG: translation elongation factor Ts [Bacilli bacterium]|nr:translation elongation factor Ts [Bacilli bacterium]MBO6286742.1 translation elongation factor Ts [Bacilli bacterium]
MAAVTIQMIKALQDRTGAGIMDCKKALIEAEGDEEKAIDILREKGIAKAAAKAGRTAAEGLAYIKVCEKCGRAVIVEVNCETDFVSGSPKFAEVVDAIASRLLEKSPASLEEAKEATQDIFTDAVVAMRENFVLRRYEILTLGEGEAFGTYTHMGGKISALVQLSKDCGEVNRGLAMTVVSGKPDYLSLEDIPSAVRARERALAEKEVAEDPKLTSKPDAVKAQIVERKVDKTLGAACLDHNVYALDPNGTLTVPEVCKQNDVKVIRFVRYEVGDGIEKPADAE